jgi:hypothetical protein
VEYPDRKPQIVNASIDFHHTAKLKMRAGQFFVPFELEGSQPIFANPAIERSTATQILNPFNLFSDVGVRLSDIGELGQFTYAGAIADCTLKKVLLKIHYGSKGSRIIALTTLRVSIAGIRSDII